MHTPATMFAFNGSIGALVVALLPTLLLLQLHGTWATEATACGTCDSLGYECANPAFPPLDNCNASVDPSTCPVTSCATYCQTLLSLHGGYCDPETHTCNCHGTLCTRGLCDRLRDRFQQCIPSGTIDECASSLAEGQVDPSTCPVTLPGCPDNCVCVAETGTCDCPPDDNGGGGDDPATAKGDSNPKKASGGSGGGGGSGVAAASSLPPRSTKKPPRFVFGSGAIAGTVVQAVGAVLAAISICHAWANKKEPPTIRL